MESIYKQLGISDKVIKHTKPLPKIKYETVKSIIPDKEDYNFQMDLLDLPTTKEGYKKLLVMVDLATDEIDFEPIKNKESKTVLIAMKKIFERPYLNKPYASIRTDSGGEFKKMWISIYIMKVYYIRFHYQEDIDRPQMLRVLIDS